MPMTQDELIQGGMVEIIRPPGSRKLYLIPGETMGMKIPQTLVALTEQEFEEYKQAHNVIIELGTAHPDLMVGIEWDVTGIRRLDIANLPGHPMRKKDDDEMDSGFQYGEDSNCRAEDG